MATSFQTVRLSNLYHHYHILTGLPKGRKNSHIRFSFPSSLGRPYTIKKKAEGTFFPKKK